MTTLDPLGAAAPSTDRKAFLRGLAATFAVGLGWNQLHGTAHASTDSCAIFCNQYCGSGNCIHSNAFICSGCGQQPYVACFNRPCTGFCLTTAC